MVDVERKRLVSLLQRLSKLVEAGISLELIDQLDALILYLLGESQQPLVQIPPEKVIVFRQRIQNLLAVALPSDVQSLLNEILTDLQD